MSRLLPALFLALLLPGAALAESQLAAARDPLSAYGGSAAYEVRRDGTPIGEHRVTFTQAPDGGLRVAARTDIEVGLLGLTLYRFHYHSTALWRDGRLVDLEARTDDDGEVRQMTARRTPDGRLEVRGSEGVWRAEGQVFPTNHWNPRVLAERPEALLNTLNGQRAQVTLTPRGETRVPCGAATCPAEAWRYDGDFSAEVFYDDQGRWLGMRFSARDGSRIDYVCRSCRPAELAARPRAESEKSEPLGGSRFFAQVGSTP